MAEYKFTPDQEKVIELRDCNILVSAAAGSGKTAVLSERIVTRICEEENPVSVDKILIVTFTRAAAAEMKERIGAALRKRLKMDPENRYINKQLTLLPTAHITTIDSFCLYLLRNHFDEIGLDPSFRVADEAELKLMKQDVMEKVFLANFESETEAFADFIEAYAGKGKLKDVCEMVERLYTFSCSHPFPLKWLEACEKELLDEKDEDSFFASPFMKYIKDYEDALLEESLKELAEAVQICCAEQGPFQYLEMMQEDIQYYETLRATTGYRERSRLIMNHTYTDLSRKKVENDPEKKELAKTLRNRSKKRMEEWKKLVYFATPEQIVKDNAFSGKNLLELIRLTKEYTMALTERKREKNVLDFSDAEHLALQILLKDENPDTPSDVALTYREHFQEIMVDEYQDSNAVQEMLLDSISRQEADFGNRFVVGDVKQSIYRFRLAKPEIFMEKANSFSTEGGVNRRINLSKNFRSRQEVVDSVNKIFEEIMIPQVGKIEYDTDARLNCGADYPESGESNKTEILMIPWDAVEEAQNEGLMEKRDKLELEAEVIASKIKELHGRFMVYDKGVKKMRPAKYSDMVILVRTAKDVDRVIKKVLESRGVPAYITAGSGYFDTPEIALLLNVLSILANPRKDIPLLGVLHGYPACFTEEEIGRIRNGGQFKELLYDSLLRYEAEGNNEVLRNKITGFLEGLNRFREKQIYTSVSFLIEELIRETDYLNYCAALPGGEQRKANVYLLMQRAKAFETTGYSGLSDFLRYIEQIKKKDLDFGEANILGEDADVVRIMTIHKSKGLEFPICFVANLGKGFNAGKHEGPVLIDEELGLAGDVIDHIGRKKRKTLKKLAFSMKNAADDMGERIRILYVALTRAKEKLFMTGVMKSMIQPGESDETGLMDILEAKSFAELCFPIANRKTDMFDIICYTPEMLTAFEAESALEVKASGSVLDNLKGELHIRSFRYPHSSLEGLYTKTTVSELKKAAYLEIAEYPDALYPEKELLPYIPGFIEEKEEDGMGARRGSAYHRIMELLDFTAFDEAEKKGALLEEARKSFVANLLIPKEEDALVRGDKVLAFLDTDLAKRMAKAEREGLLYKEQPFVLGLPADRVNGAFPADETVLIQGVIDGYFVEEGEIVVLDYKTDAVKEAEELVLRYKTQMDYYGEALERLEKKKVKEKLIYSFALHKMISL